MICSFLFNNFYKLFAILYLPVTFPLHMGPDGKVSKIH